MFRKFLWVVTFTLLVTSVWTFFVAKSYNSWIQRNLEQKQKISDTGYARLDEIHKARSVNIEKVKRVNQSSTSMISREANAYREVLEEQSRNLLAQREAVDTWMENTSKALSDLVDFDRYCQKVFYLISFGSATLATSLAFYLRSLRAKQVRQLS